MAKKYLVIGDLRGGRNGADAPLSLPDTQAVECLNVDFYDSTLGRKRNGAAEYVDTFAAGATTPTGLISSLFYGTYSYGSVAFCVDNAATPILNYTTAGTSWTKINLGDTIASAPYAVQTATFNNRVYFAFDSSVNRLHFWALESTLDDNTLYRVGLPAPTAAPTAANAGGGDQYGTTRYYKVAWITKPGTTIENRGELSASVEYDPATTAGPVRVTQPAVPSGENITHWEVYGSTDNVNFVLLSTVAIGTTTYDDAANPAAYTGTSAPTVGINTVPVSWKHIASDGNRLLGAGNWEGGNQSRVWFTPVYGALDVGDAERVPLNNYIDVGAYDGDAVTGLVGSFMGNTVVFKSRQIWRLVPTGDGDAPYKAVCLTKAIGCVATKSIVVGEDENGSPALYFMSHRGPYRIGTGGLEYVGRDIEDITALLNQSATVVSHAVWHPARHQMWFWLALNSDTYPTVRVVLDTHLCRRSTGGVRGGWVKQTGVSCTAVCSMMYGSTLKSGNYRNATNPYVGSSVTNNLILRCDEAAVWADNGTAYQSYIKTKPYALGGLGFNCAVGQSHLSAKAASGATITQTLDRDYGAETRTSTCSLTATGLETRVQRQFEGSDLAGAGVVQMQLGDASASSQSWTLDALMVPYTGHEER